jgi:DNA invertase Pin-like site-specific DNA recombinase
MERHPLPRSEVMNFVAYYRVSTARQGASGLGLDAQREAVKTYLRMVGAYQLVREFVEVESGKRDDRPELAKALTTCKLYGARLVVSKLDRLARDAHFLLGLQKAGVPFVAADMPDANEMTVGIMAVVAQAERKMISQRTKAALAAAKARGIRLGNPDLPRGTAATAAIATAAKVKRAAENAQRFAEPIARARAAGAISLRQIAAALEREGIPRPRGGRAWTPVGVQSILRKLEK